MEAQLCSRSSVFPRVIKDIKSAGTSTVMRQPTCTAVILVTVHYLVGSHDVPRI